MKRHGPIRWGMFERNLPTKGYGTFQSDEPKSILLLQRDQCLPFSSIRKHVELTWRRIIQTWAIQMSLVFSEKCGGTLQPRKKPHMSDGRKLSERTTKWRSRNSKPNNQSLMQHLEPVTARWSLWLLIRPRTNCRTNVLHVQKAFSSHGYSETITRVTTDNQAVNPIRKCWILHSWLHTASMQVHSTHRNHCLNSTLIPGNQAIRYTLHLAKRVVIRSHPLPKFDSLGDTIKTTNPTIMVTIMGDTFDK